MKNIPFVLAFKEMEAIGWTNFDMKNEHGKNVLLAANTMSKIAAMQGDLGKIVKSNIRFISDTCISISMNDLS